MAQPIITLTTDFGTRSPFVAAVKGVILSVNPDAHIVDLSHDIPPYDLRHAAFFLADALPYFPPGTLHVVVVDPGVGGERAILYVAVGDQRLLVPDNGCWAVLADRHGPPCEVIRVTEPRFWRPAVSATFHGRDIFAPVAAHLSLGVDPIQLGPRTTQWQQPAWPTPANRPDGIAGEVLFVDGFGNLITNISSADLAAAGPRPGRVCLGSTVVPRLVRTYSDAAPGELVALVSSNGLLEVAEVQGNAARRLSAGPGASVLVEWPS
jgi:S-adenosylmethionine hydrolase